MADERALRKSWGVGDRVEVFSKSRQEWFPAKIIEVYEDEDGEWLAVVVAETMIKEVQRFNSDVRPIKATPAGSESDTEDSSGEYSESGSETDMSTDMEASDDEKLDQRKKDKKKKKKLAQHSELVVVFVTRAGTDVVNGKYVYSTTQNGYPVFKKIETEENVRFWRDDRDRWILSHSRAELYVCDVRKVNRDLPPSSGWQCVKGEPPNPGVRLDQLKSNQEEQQFEDDPFKFSPFDFLNVEFDISRKVGFKLELVESHAQFVAVKSIDEESQAAQLDLQPGDYLVNCNGEDLSQIKNVPEAMATIEDHVAMALSKTKGSNAKGTISITFARQKKVFQVIMVQRGGTAEVNGKYTISGEENGALKFVKNDDPSFSLCRIYVNQEEDEAIWAIRKEGKDYYIILASAKDQTPRECGWEAVDPDGLWPAAGLTYYDVNITKPGTPVITDVVPNPSAVQIHFSCDGERRPQVCPHMDIWFEVECRHIPSAKHVKAFSSRVVNFAGIDDDDDDDAEEQKEDKASRTRVIRADQSPVVFNKLTNGEKYVFTVRNANQVTSSSSVPCDPVIPLRLPPKPRIRDIKGFPGELLVVFSCPRAGNHDVQATFEIIVDPPIPPKQQFHTMKEGRIIVDDDSLPVRLRGLTNGQTYKIIVACVNTVGVTYSEPESAYPSKAPPQPQLTEVEAGNREITIHFDCPGYDDPEVKAWFEVDVDPPPPELIGADALASPTAEEEKSPMKRHKSTRSRMRLGGRKKSAWARKMTMPDEDDDHETFVPVFRQEKRYMSSPIRIAPLNNGQEYCVRVKAVNLTGSKITAFSEPRMPKGPPPMPKITKVEAKEASALVHFECDDYATEKFKASFEVETKPGTATVRAESCPVEIEHLRNGVNYRFLVRAFNDEGRSKWSDQSVAVTPLMKPPEPVNLFPVAYDAEISVFWVCEELNAPHYQGWYEVMSDPPTYTMVVSRQQARFRRLKNGVGYKFKVIAVNEVDRSESAWSGIHEPSEKAKREQYQREKKRVACVVREQMLEMRKKRQQEEHTQKVALHEQKRKQIANLEEREARTELQKQLAKEKRKKKKQKQRQEKKANERKARKKKMEEHRKKVLMNKRRISMIHRSKIDQLQQQWNRSANPVSMVSQSRAAAGKRTKSPPGGKKKRGGKGSAKKGPRNSQKPPKVKTGSKIEVSSPKTPKSPGRRKSKDPRKSATSPSGRASRRGKRTPIDQEEDRID